MGARPERTDRTGSGAEQVGEAAQDVYYGRVARSDEEAAALREAARIQGLEHEIAMLRVRLLSALDEDEVDLTRVLKGCEVLTRAVATQYRISPKSRKDLSDSLAAALNTFGDLILPADR
jgi:hypothetical protein